LRARSVAQVLSFSRCLALPVSLATSETHDTPMGCRCSQVYTAWGQVATICLPQRVAQRTFSSCGVFSLRLLSNRSEVLPLFASRSELKQSGSTVGTLFPGFSVCFRLQPARTAPQGLGSRSPADSRVLRPASWIL